MKFSISMFCFLIGACSSVSVPDEFAYIVVDAKVEDKESKQPTWIAYVSAMGATHLSADKVISPIWPSLYEFSHIDFGNQFQDHTVWPRVSNPSRFQLKPGTIYFIGTIQMELKKASRSRYSYRVSRDKSLIEEACQQSPSLFKRYPLVISQGNGFSEPIKFDCESASKD